MTNTPSFTPLSTINARGSKDFSLSFGNNTLKTVKINMQVSAKQQ